MDFMLPFFQLLYFVVHFLFSLAEGVVDCFYELYHTILNIIWWKWRFVPSQHRLMKDASQLKKLPRHLGFVFSPRQTSYYKNICYVINWAVGFGIHDISLYDIDGVLKLKLPSLLDNLRVICADITFKVLVDDQIYIRESQDEFVVNNSKSDHTHRKSAVITETQADFLTKYCKKTVITLNILCVEDGKEDVVNIAKFSSTETNQPISTDYITSNLITKGQVDPDLVILLGRPTCTLGFLPWQIRLTEFHNIPSVNRLDYYNFKKILQIYSKCQQRCGS